MTDQRPIGELPQFPPQGVHVEGVDPLAIDANQTRKLLDQGHDSSDRAETLIAGDVEKAEVLAAQVGDEAQVFLDEARTLERKIREDTAAFEAKVERLSSPYVLSPELAKVLETARLIGRPLLLEGEPGTGKTALAYALAGEEGLRIIHAQAKSTTTAQAMLYTFDVVKRLQDAQLGKEVSDLEQYVHLGPIGRALAAGEQVILLIDEIDKAKQDFPNDLLHELEKMSFIIDETGREVAAVHRPIVIITSNHEKDLPEPFLRRTVYHYIDFPTPGQMSEIVKAHIPDVSERLLESALRRFYEIRQTKGLEKPPSTSEILDWIEVLRAEGVDEVSGTPHPETLLKGKKDVDRVFGNSERSRREIIGLPEDVAAVLRGERVVRLKPKSEYDYDRNKPDAAIYTLLANEGYEFTLADFADYYSQIPFDIHANGVVRVGDLTFALYNPRAPKQGEPYLYELLKKKNLIDGELLLYDKPIEFESVEESTPYYTKGKEKGGVTIYRTRDGRFMFWKSYRKKSTSSEQNKDAGIFNPFDDDN